VGFLKRLLGVEPKLVKLVSACIITDEDHKYFVSFSKHHPQLQLPEYVRLVLHYYAKILFNFDPSDPTMTESARTLKSMMDSVLAAGIHRESDIFYHANVDDVSKMVSSPPTNQPREIRATLYFVDTIQRHITTEVPGNLYAQHMVISVMAALKGALKEMDKECTEILHRSLTNMNRAYDSGESHSELRNLAAIPTTAYMSAIMGE
jgi:hypothetical protein